MRKIRYIIVILLIILIVFIFLLIIKKREEKNIYNNNIISNNLIDSQSISNNTEENSINNYNKFDLINVNSGSLLNLYWSQFKDEAMFNIEESYNLLDIEYREKKFNDIEEYKEYINANIEILENSSIQTFDLYNNEDYTLYKCKDNYGRLFIIKEYSIKQYTLMLDIYTIDTLEFLENYSSSNNQVKVALNIQKFMQAINAKDYNYAYNCLSDGFKSNYFNTVEEFENYISQNLYSNNEIEYIEFKEESGLYTYTIQIVNTDNPDESIEKTIVMKLNEGTDFEMSFNI